MEDQRLVHQRQPGLAAISATSPGMDDFGTASPDLACITDGDGIIKTVNPAWRRVLGWTRSELVGHPFLDLVHEDDLNRMCAALDQALAGTTVLDLSGRWATADGTWRWVAWSMALGPGQRVYGSGRDITDRVEVQLGAAQTVVDLRAELDAERAAVDELRERDQRKDTYLSAVSHELRTPVMLAQGAAETLAARRDQLPAAEVTELENLIVAQTLRLSRVITGLFDIDRLANGQLTAARRPVELVGLVEGAIAASPTRDRINLVAPDEVHLSADAAQVAHIVTNLLENADKYAPDGAVCVIIDADRRHVRIGVRDQGPGIPSSALERVFEPFWRVDPEGASPGSGVGLALVAEFARLHDGRAWAEPVGRGAHLIVELPIEAPA